jgi:hypothetical protein
VQVYHSPLPNLALRFHKYFVSFQLPDGLIRVRIRHRPASSQRLSLGLLPFHIRVPDSSKHSPRSFCLRSRGGSSGPTHGIQWLCVSRQGRRRHCPSCQKYPVHRLVLQAPGSLHSFLKSFDFLLGTQTQVKHISSGSG